MRTHPIRSSFLAAVLLLAFSFYIYVHEAGVSYTFPASILRQPTHYFSFASLRNLLHINALSLPKNVQTIGVLDAKDGCRRLWLTGGSTWFDVRNNRTISPLWTRRNERLTSAVAKWWKTLQASKKMNMAAVVDAAMRIVPNEDPYRVQNLSSCRRCAVVGNSGNLRGSHYGSLIDSHQLVFRINKAPTEGFSADVGIRETHRLAYPESYTAPTPGANFVLMDFKLLDVAWLTSALTNGAIQRTYMTVPSRINISRSKVMIYNPTLMHHVHTVWTEGHGRYPSTGNLAMFFALQICDEVSLFGFGANDLGNWDHYWQRNNGRGNSLFKQTGVHDSDFEQSLMKNLEDAGKVTIYSGVR